MSKQIANTINTITIIFTIIMGLLRAGLVALSAAHNGSLPLTSTIITAIAIISALVVIFLNSSKDDVNAVIKTWSIVTAIFVLLFYNMPAMQACVLLPLIAVVLSQEQDATVLSAFFAIASIIAANVIQIVTAGFDLSVIISSVITLICIGITLYLISLSKVHQIDMLRQKQAIAAQGNIYKKELHYDNLTGVYSRAWLMYNAQEKITHMAGHRRISVAMIDIDHFKNVNDTYGHDAGDKVLERLGKILQKVQGERIIVGRYGGEEFTIVFDNHPDDVDIMNQLRETFKQQTFDFTNEHFSFSGGLYVIPEAMDAGQAIKQADNALYFSKEHGRDRITVSGE